MPKINVYLPDDLAEAVKAAGVPVSAICQRALEQAVRRVTAIREMALIPQDVDQPSGALAHLTPRTRVVVVKLAQEAAKADGAASVGTEHLLAGMLNEGSNLALHVLRAMDIDPEQVGRDLSRHRPAQRPESTPDGDAPMALSTEAANALELTVTEATSLGHNYVGCEHLLLGLVAEPDGVAGQVLRGLGAEPRLTRRAVVAALAGYVHLRGEAQQSAAQAGEARQGAAAAQAGEAQQGAGAAQAGQAAGASAMQARLAAAIRQELQPFVQRLERLEERLEERLGPDA